MVIAAIAGVSWCCHGVSWNDLALNDSAAGSLKN